MLLPETAAESPLLKLPSYPPWAEIHELAEQLLDHNGAASVYLNLAPREIGEVRDRGLQEHAMLDELRKDAETAAANTSDHERKLALRAIPERIEAYLANLEPRRRHIHGVAVFATTQGYFRGIELPSSLGNVVSLERSPRIAPLVSLYSRSHAAVIVLLDSEFAKILLSAEGALHELEDVKNRRGELYEAHVLAHFKEVAEHLAAVSRHERRPIVLVGIEEFRGPFERELDEQSRELVSGWASVDLHAPLDGVAAAARPLLDRWWAGRVRELLDAWHESTAKHAHGVAGFEDTLGAAADGAVELLLYQDDPTVEWPAAFECQICGRGSAFPGSCPLDGGKLIPRADGLEVVIRETLRYGGRALGTERADDLARAGGIGALTRYQEL